MDVEIYRWIANLNHLEQLVGQLGCNALPRDEVLDRHLGPCALVVSLLAPARGTGPTLAGLDAPGGGGRGLTAVLVALIVDLINRKHISILYRIPSTNKSEKKQVSWYCTEYRVLYSSEKNVSWYGTGFSTAGFSSCTYSKSCMYQPELVQPVFRHVH